MSAENDQAVSDTSFLRRSAQRIGALFAGLVAVIVLSLGTDLVLHATGIFPQIGQPMPDSLFLLASAYRCAYSVLGCYLTARLAPDHPMLHAMLLGLMGLALSIIGALVTWDDGPAFGPHWYPLALIATALPTAWLGGKLRLLQLSRSAK